MHDRLAQMFCEVNLGGTVFNCGTDVNRLVTYPHGASALHVMSVQT